MIDPVVLFIHSLNNIMSSFVDRIFLSCTCGPDFHRCFLLSLTAFLVVVRNSCFIASVIVLLFVVYFIDVLFCKC